MDEFDDPPSAPSSPSPVTPSTRIADVLASRPDAARVLWEEFDLPCWDCEVAFHETIAEGAAYRGLDPALLADRLDRCPARPASEGPSPR